MGGGHPAAVRPVAATVVLPAPGRADQQDGERVAVGVGRAGGGRRGIGTGPPGGSWTWPVVSAGRRRRRGCGARADARRGPARPGGAAVAGPGGGRRRSAAADGGRLGGGRGRGCAPGCCGPGWLAAGGQSPAGSVPRPVGRRQRSPHCVLHPVPLAGRRATAPPGPAAGRGCAASGAPTAWLHPVPLRLEVTSPLAGDGARRRPRLTERYRPRPPFGERPGAARSARVATDTGEPGRAARAGVTAPTSPYGGEQHRRVGALQHGRLGQAVQDDEAQQVAAGLLVDLHGLQQLGPLVAAVGAAAARPTPGPRGAGRRSRRPAGPRAGPVRRRRPCRRRRPRRAATCSARSSRWRGRGCARS